MKRTLCDRSTTQYSAVDRLWPLLRFFRPRKRLPVHITLGELRPNPDPGWSFASGGNEHDATHPWLIMYDPEGRLWVEWFGRYGGVRVRIPQEVLWRVGGTNTSASAPRREATVSETVEKLRALLRAEARGEDE